MLLPGVPVPGSLRLCSHALPGVGRGHQGVPAGSYMVPEAPLAAELPHVLLSSAPDNETCLCAPAWGRHLRATPGRATAGAMRVRIPSHSTKSSPRCVGLFAADKISDQKIRFCSPGQGSHIPFTHFFEDCSAQHSRALPHSAFGSGSGRVMLNNSSDNLWGF